MDAVSYTHLDVYKRQISLSALQLKKFMRLMTTRLWGSVTLASLSHEAPAPLLS